MENPRHWRLKQQRYSLVGEICLRGHKSFPPTGVCYECVRELKEEAMVTPTEVILYEASSAISLPREVSMSSR